MTEKVKGCFDTQESFNIFMKDWFDLIYSHTEDLYWSKLSRFEAIYKLSYPLIYTMETWLTYKEMFVTAWTRQYLHLGNVATSRVEGSHAALKHYIMGPSGDILLVWERIDEAIKAQLDALTSELAINKIETLTYCSQQLYSEIKRRASRYSINLVKDQADKAKRATPIAPLSPCTNVFTRTMGLPCAHRIASLLKDGQPIPLADIHPFWRIGLSPQAGYLPLLNPLLPVPISKGKSAGNEADSDTRTTKPKKAPSKCSICGVVGHTRRTCGK